MGVPSQSVENAVAATGSMLPVSLRRDADCADDGQNDAHKLAAQRGAASLDAGDEHDEYEAASLEHGCRARIADRDAPLVAHLNKQHAEDGEHKKAPQLARLLEQA